MVEQRRANPEITKLYAALLPSITEAARARGYAIAVHGSLATDMDLVAVPWTEEAVEPEALVEAIGQVVGGIVINQSDMNPQLRCFHNPNPKPHGRQAWSIYLVDELTGPYIDLSVMPRLTPEANVEYQALNAASDLMWHIDRSEGMVKGGHTVPWYAFPCIDALEAAVNKSKGDYSVPDTIGGRIDAANELIRVVAGCGHRHFEHGVNRSCSRFELSCREGLVFYDDYQGKKVFPLLDTRKAWANFNNGGGLRYFIECLAGFIETGKQLVHNFEPRYNHWGYGDDLNIVRDAAIRLGISPAPEVAS